MSDHIRYLRVREIPDPSYVPFKDISTNPRQAISTAVDHVRRYIASLPPDSVTFSMAYVYDPVQGQQDPQKRLAVYLRLRAKTRRRADAMTTLLTRGQLAKFVSFDAVDEMPVQWNKFTAATFIGRVHQRITPLTQRDLNPEIPKQYYQSKPFNPNDANDWTVLDWTLDGVDGPVLIDIAVSATGCTKEREASALYLDQLLKINRPRDLYHEHGVPADLLSESSSSRFDQSVVTPFHVPDPMAQEVSREYQRLHETLQHRQLAFHITVLAVGADTSHLIGSTVAESAFEEGAYQLHHASSPEEVSKAIQAISAVKVLDPCCGATVQRPSGRDEYADLRRLPWIASEEELAGILRIPIATTGSPRCIRKNTDPPPLTGTKTILIGHDYNGMDLATAVPRGILLELLCKSMFIAGAPGCGKSTNDMALMLDLSRYDVPFLAIECVKKEYRAIKNLKNYTDQVIRHLAKSLEIYTPGAENLSPLRHSILEIDPGASVATQVDAVQACFDAAMPMGGPLGPLLYEATEETYELAQEKGFVPTVRDLLDVSDRVVRRKGYAGDVGANLPAALDVRIGRLTRGNVGHVFGCAASHPSVDRLFKSSTIVELDHLNDSYSACLITLGILMKIRAALKAMPPPVTKPMLVIFLAEAHRILGGSKTTGPSEDSADPQAFVVETLCQMLAELRALGVGIVISDQSPAAVPQEVIKHTATKLAFRLVDPEDRSAMGASMLFGERDYDNVARLQPGQAYLFTEGYYEPRLIRTINLHEEL